MTRTVRTSHHLDPLMTQRAQRIAAVTLTSLALGVPAFSSAQTPTPAPAAQQQQVDKVAAEAAFKRADANQDGKLSKEEAARLPAVAGKFAELDKDKDGALNMDEFLAGYTAR